MAKGFIDSILDQIFDSDWIGRRGEKLTERELNLVKLFGRKGKVLRNLYVPKDNGETSEIDVVFITRKGIFVIESKNFSGWIFGDEKSAYWTVMLPNKEKNRFYNPIMQNRSHIKWLGQYLDKEIPLFSIVVFSERCELKRVTIESQDVYVIKRDYLYATVRSIWDKSENYLDEAEVEELQEKLKVLTYVDSEKKRSHIDNIKTRYKKDETVDSEKAISKEAGTNIVKPDLNLKDELICPRCGNKLILRTAKKGVNAGKQFYGCSGFPKCRYVKPIENEQGSD